MAAYTQYLWEDYLRNSDVGQAAILEAEKEEVEHKKLLAENDRVSKHSSLEAHRLLVPGDQVSDPGGGENFPLPFLICDLMIAFYLRINS